MPFYTMSFQNLRFTMMFHVRDDTPRNSCHVYILTEASNRMCSTVSLVFFTLGFSLLFSSLHGHLWTKHRPQCRWHKSSVLRFVWSVRNEMRAKFLSASFQNSWINMGQWLSQVKKRTLMNKEEGEEAKELFAVPAICYLISITRYRKEWECIRLAKMCE